MTKKKHEELVEEIRDQLHRLGDVEFDYIQHLELPVQEMDVIEEIITLVLSAFRDRQLDEELEVVARVTGHILHFPHDDKPWTPATHFRATGSHSSLALADGLIGNDGEEAEAVIITLSETGKEED